MAIVFLVPIYYYTYQRIPGWCNQVEIKEGMSRDYRPLGGQERDT